MKTPEAPALRILKIQNTRSLSGASELTYHLGCDDQDNLYIRLWSNSAGGLHSKHWFSLARILERLTDDKPITSGTLRPVCPGSMNNGGFILAALRHEGLVNGFPPRAAGLRPLAPPLSRRPGRTIHPRRSPGPVPSQITRTPWPCPE